jgi:hypothetical protein
MQCTAFHAQTAIATLMGSLAIPTMTTTTPAATSSSTSAIGCKTLFMMASDVTIVAFTCLRLHNDITKMTAQPQN